MITIKRIDATRKKDINIKNQPFRLFGRLLPSYNQGEWSYETERFEEKDCSTMCFPDENYDYDALAKNSVFLGAYDGETCIGLAILRQAWFQYMYLYDLKVNEAYRGENIGTKLIEKAREIARESGYRGLYTQAQDNNLGACLFYLRNGFFIGGLDTQVYRGTPQEGKRDVFFYLDL